jgi:hypothetical protein
MFWVPAGVPRPHPDAPGSLGNSFWWGYRVLSSILDTFRDQDVFARVRAKLSKIRNEGIL